MSVEHEAAYVSRVREVCVEEPFNVDRIREDFPILESEMRGRPLVYLDNAATSQKPRAVLEALAHFYLYDNANVHRGAYALGDRATAAYELARTRVQRFIHAAHAHELVFLRGTTEGINLVAQTYGRVNVGPGDEVVISVMEHHSNIVPWQMLCQEKGARLRVIPVDDDGELVLEALEDLLGPRTKIVAVSHASNILGTVNPIRRIVERAHAWGSVVVVDGAQATPHLPVDVQALDCDFYAFSGHKMYGPMGVGVLYGKERLLEAMPPYQGGGSMILSVTFERTLYNELPYKFEAGTPDVAGAVGLGAAIEYLEGIGLPVLEEYEQELLTYATAALTSVPGLRLLGTAREKIGVLSFVLDRVHPHDIATLLDGEGIAIRTGHHCAQPLMARFGVPATARASLAFYNTCEEVDALVAGLLKVKEIFHDPRAG